MSHDHLAPGRRGLLRATALPQRGQASRIAMAALARDLLASLPEDGRRRATRPFADEERFNWHYVPRERAGLPVRAMPPDGKAALHALLGYALSEAGYGKATGIFRIEEVLGQIEGRPHYRDPENYSLTVFGEPGREPWGWRLEGHHLSLNFTAVTEELIAAVPMFWGANPARVPEGYPMTGHRVLGTESDLAHELVRGLDEAQRARATICEDSLGNIVAGPGREKLVQEREGLPLADMAEGARNLAIRLLEAYAGNLRVELAANELQRIREAGLGEVRFAWGGALDDGRAHYWRLHGPITLIEFDNTQNDANHIHSVWHDLARNFGRDLLRDHYENGHPHGH